MKALDIEAVEINWISDGDIFQNAININRLPLREVTLEDLSENKSIILSWRWDIKDDRSLNVALAIVAAKTANCKFLLFDKISVNQEKNGEELSREVIIFSRLYSYLPVICAYDSVDHTDNRLHNS